MTAPAGRYAPSPTGDLHLGNLRTAVLAWLAARSTGRRFVLRVEDIDRQRSRPQWERRQLEDLAALGLNWDGPVVRQSDRGELYSAALNTLADADLVYECYCTRREIQQAASAPHAAPGYYPGTCRHLTATQRAAYRAEGRRPALRLRSPVAEWTVTDLLAGQVTGLVDDLVLRRSDGDWAYNLAAVVDDADQGVDQVVRGNDLLTSAPRQAALAHLLGLPAPSYLHVPLVLGPTGARLAKRDGAVTLRQLAGEGLDPRRVRQVVEWITGTVGQGGVDTLGGLIANFNPGLLPSDPVTWVPEEGSMEL